MSEPRVIPHADNSYGDCVSCRFWVGEDDDGDDMYVAASFPCPYAPPATPHVHEYRCSCGESCPHVAALDLAHRALGSFLWLGNNLRNAGTDTFREMYEACLSDARRAYEAGAALDGEQNARGGG